MYCLYTYMYMYVYEESNAASVPAERSSSSLILLANSWYLRYCFISELIGLPKRKIFLILWHKILIRRRIVGSRRRLYSSCYAYTSLCYCSFPRSIYLRARALLSDSLKHSKTIIKKPCTPALLCKCKRISTYNLIISSLTRSRHIFQSCSMIPYRQSSGLVPFEQSTFCCFRVKKLCIKQDKWCTGNIMRW